MQDFSIQIATCFFEVKAFPVKYAAHPHHTNSPRNLKLHVFEQTAKNEKLIKLHDEKLIAMSSTKARVTFGRMGVNITSYQVHNENPAMSAHLASYDTGGIGKLFFTRASQFTSPVSTVRYGRTWSAVPVDEMAIEMTESTASRKMLIYVQAEKSSYLRTNISSDFDTYDITKSLNPFHPLQMDGLDEVMPQYELRYGNNRILYEKGIKFAQSYDEGMQRMQFEISHALVGSKQSFGQSDPILDYDTVQQFYRILFINVLDNEHPTAERSATYSERVCSSQNKAQTRHVLARHRV